MTEGAYELLYAEGTREAANFRIRGSLPTDGWRPADDTRAALSAGQGLSPDDRAYLRKACLEQAHDLESRDEIRAAADRYFLLLGNFIDGVERGQAVDAIKRLSLASPREVAASLATAVVDHPAAFTLSGAQAFLPMLIARNEIVSPCTTQNPTR
jgi:hypothetical protein